MVHNVQIKNGKIFIEPPAAGQDFKSIFLDMVAVGAGRKVDNNGRSPGPWTPELLAEEISFNSSNGAGVDVRSVQRWFQDNQDGISKRNCAFLAEIFGCGDVRSENKWRAALAKSLLELGATRKLEATRNGMPNAVPPVRQNRPEPQRVTLAMRTERQFRDGAPFGIVVSMWASVAVLLYLGYLLGAHDVSYSPIPNVEKQVGLFWSPNWFWDKLIWLPLIVFTISSLITSWREQWRPMLIANSSEPTRTYTWEEKLSAHTSSFIGIAVVCFFIVFLLQWYGAYCQPLLQGDAGTRVIDWLLVSIERPDVMSTAESMAASLFANFLSGIAYWFCFSGLMLLYIVSTDFKDISVLLEPLHGTDEDLDFLRIANSILSSAFCCVVFALITSIGIKTVAVYLMTDAENILRWLVLDAIALVNGENSTWSWFDKNPSASIASFFVMFIPVFVFFVCASKINRSIQELFSSKLAEKNKHAALTVAINKVKLQWMTWAGIILLLVANFWLIGRFTGFSVLLIASSCLALIFAFASRGSDFVFGSPQKEKLLAPQGK